LTLTGGFFPSYEVSLYKQTTGKKSFHYLRKYPEVGFLYRYSDHGGSQYLGASHVVMPYINFPLIRKNGFVINFNVGLGMGYLTKKFHRLKNYQNLAIGSHLNAAINLQIQLKIRISRRVFLSAGGGILHLSNGTIKTPNYGLNIPSVFGGLSYKLNHRKINFRVPEVIKKNRGTFNFSMLFGAAMKEIPRQYDMHYPVYFASASVSGYYNNVNRFSIGLDAVFDEANIALLERAGDTIQFAEQAIKYGVNAGHEWVFSRVSMSFKIGYYIYARYESDGPVYNKIGVKYSISDYVNISLILNAHYARADFLAFGIGFTL